MRSAASASARSAASAISASRAFAAGGGGLLAGGERVGPRWLKASDAEIALAVRSLCLELADDDARGSLEARSDDDLASLGGSSDGGHSSVPGHGQRKPGAARGATIPPVSYTHLTLPTILLV